MSKVKSHKIDEDEQSAWIIDGPDGKFLAHCPDSDWGHSCNLYRLELITDGMSIDSCERYANGGNPITDHLTVVEPRQCPRCGDRTITNPENEHCDECRENY